MVTFVGKVLSSLRLMVIGRKIIMSERIEPKDTVRRSPAFPMMFIVLSIFMGFSISVVMLFQEKIKDSPTEFILVIGAIYVMIVFVVSIMFGGMRGGRR